MNLKTNWLGMVSIGLVWLAGCATTPDAPGFASSAAPVTDRASVAFDEVVAAVPVEGAGQVYQNLHVGLAAVITGSNASSNHTSQVDWIARRLEPKVAAATLQVVMDGSTLSPHKLGPVRETVAARAQEVAKESLRQWALAADYEVEITVTSLYFTDSSVGRGLSLRGR